MQRCMTGILTGVILLCSTAAVEAVSPGRMISSIQSGELSGKCIASGDLFQGPLLHFLPFVR